jgi:mannose-6-phosphate isomerase-like protein (cupin superfamily)
MPADRGPDRLDARQAVAYRISPGDTVKLALVRGPDEHYDASVFLEIWEPGGAQPPNGHPRSVETFFFLAGAGTAHCDDREVDVEAGQLLVLPERSLHRIVNTSATKLVAITTMTPDDGFAALVLAGEPTPITEDELALVGWSDPRSLDEPGSS